MARLTTVERETVYARAGACCEVCGSDLAYRVPNGGWSIHHRLPRGRGGNNQASNLMLLCGSGVTGCHGRIESHRAIAYDAGWLVRTGYTPAEVPVMLHGDRLVYLDDDGCYAHGAP